MADESISAHVSLWHHHVGTVTWNEQSQLARFTYEPEFLRTGLEVAPIMAPLGRQAYAFPELNAQVFKGLPGFLADSLPDKFGNRVLDAWRAVHGELSAPFNPVAQLCTLGSRGMGALEYTPETLPVESVAEPLDLPLLVRAINVILSDEMRPADFASSDLQDALRTLTQVGISADGSRAKAVVSLGPDGRVLAGHGELPQGYQHWLLKFDGITGNRDREAADPQGWGLVEYAYYRMASQAGITMSECRLLQDGERSHFVTRRFDRNADGAKLHRQSLCAIGHVDFDALGAYSYEEVLDVIRMLSLPQSALTEQFRRTIFNVLSRNHDDHAKNIAFLMDAQGRWSLAPAYDLTFAYNPEGHWTSCHQMTLNGKRDNFTYGDLLAVADHAGIAPEEADEIIAAVAAAVGDWPRLAEETGVAPELADAINTDLRLHLVR